MPRSPRHMHFDTSLNRAMILPVNFSPTSTIDPASNGVAHAHVIDLMTHDPRTDEVTLTMVERRRWNGGDQQLFELQEKFNAYLSFALDGEMFETYPALANKRLRVRLECVEAPGALVLEFLGLIREQVAFQGVEIEVVVASGGCGAGCGCADGEAASE